MSIALHSTKGNTDPSAASWPSGRLQTNLEISGIFFKKLVCFSAIKLIIWKSSVLNIDNPEAHAREFASL